MRVAGLIAVVFAVGGAGCSEQAPSPRTFAQVNQLQSTRLALAVPSTQPGPDIGSATLDVMRGQRGALGLSVLDDFALRSSEQGHDGLYHVRMQQLHQGLKVWGADAVVHRTAEKVTFFSGNLAVGVPELDVRPVISATDALAASENDYASRATGTARLVFSREKTELVLFTSKNEGIRLAWHVEFFTGLQAGLKPGLWNAFVDAADGHTIFKWNAIDSLSEASGPGGNAKVTRSWVKELDVEPKGASTTVFKMDTAKQKTLDMSNGSGTVVTGPLENIGDAAINDAHGFAKKTLGMLSDWFGYDSIDNQGFIIVSQVHYGTDFENAFWDGQEMVYGDGATLFYPLSGAVDVCGHEIDHGFTSNHSNLDYFGMSGGMNEAFSDIAGTAAEWYSFPERANFDMGEDIFRKPNEALRYMCEPTKDGTSIDNASDYNEGLDPHYSSGVMNKAFCVAAKRLASGSTTGTATQDSVKRAAKAFYEANANYWTSSSTFKQGCQGVVDAAKALTYTTEEIKSLQDSWSDVGVTCQPQ